MNGLTTRQAAAEITCDHAPSGMAICEWQVRRIFELGILPEPSKFAGKRVIDRRDIPAIVIALQHRGWLPKPEVAQ